MTRKRPAPAFPAAEDRVRMHLTGFAVAGSMLVFWSGAAAAYGIAKLVFAAGAIMTAWLSVLRSTEAPVKSPLDAPIAGAAAAFLASLVFSPDRWLGLVGVYGLYNHGFIAFFLAASSFFIFRSAQAEESYARWICAAGLLSGLYAVMQSAGTPAFAPVGRSLPQGRAVGLMGDPVFLGASLIAVIPIAGALARGRRGLWKFLGAAAFASAAAGLYVSGSRGAWAAAAAAFFVWILLDRRARGARSPRPRWVAAVLIAALLAGGALTVLRSSSDSDAGRVEVWKIALSVFKSSPVLGVGLDRFQTEMRRYRTPELIRIIGSRSTQVSAHNDWLQILATAGLVGAAAWFWLHWGLFMLLRESWSRQENRPAVAIAAGIFAGLFVQAKVNPLPLVCFLQAGAAAGMLLGSGPRFPERPFRAASGIAAAAAAVCFILALRLASADAALLRARRADHALAYAGAVDFFETAVKRNPYEMHYRVLLSRALYAASSRAEGDSRKNLLARAIAVGDEALHYRPAEAEGHLIGATYRLAMTAAGGEADLPLAARSLDIALAIDPFFTPALENGVQIQALLGNNARSAQLRAQLERVRRWRLAPADSSENQ